MRRSYCENILIIDGFTTLEYIQSGTTNINVNLPYIDTRLRLTNNHKIVVDMQYTNVNPNSGYRFTGDQTDSNQMFRFGTYCDDTYKRAFYARYGNTSKLIYTDSFPDGDDTLTNRNVIKLSKDGFYLNGTQYATFPAKTFTTTGTAYIFAIHQGSTNIDKSPAKLYSYKIYNNDELIRNYIPVIRDSDDVVGLYDICTETFYTKAAGIDFQAGPQQKKTNW